jgi:hypothetical protein
VTPLEVNKEYKISSGLACSRYASQFQQALDEMESDKKSHNILFRFNNGGSYDMLEDIKQEALERNRQKEKEKEQKEKEKERLKKEREREKEAAKRSQNAAKEAKNVRKEEVKEKAKDEDKEVSLSSKSPESQLSTMNDTTNMPRRRLLPSKELSMEASRAIIMGSVIDLCITGHNTQYSMSNIFNEPHIASIKSDRQSNKMVGSNDDDNNDDRNVNDNIDDDISIFQTKIWCNEMKGNRPVKQLPFMVSSLPSSLSSSSSTRKLPKVKENSTESTNSLIQDRLISYPLYLLDTANSSKTKVALSSSASSSSSSSSSLSSLAGVSIHDNKINGSPSKKSAWAARAAKSFLSSDFSTSLVSSLEKEEAKSLQVELGLIRPVRSAR